MISMILFFGISFSSANCDAAEAKFFKSMLF
jgi:hypothetical protein